MWIVKPEIREKIEKILREDEGRAIDEGAKMVKCKNCKEDKHIVCLCGFCNDCIKEFGHEYLAQLQLSKHKRMVK